MFTSGSVYFLFVYFLFSSIPFMFIIEWDQWCGGAALQLNTHIEETDAPCWLCSGTRQHCTQQDSSWEAENTQSLTVSDQPAGEYITVHEDAV